MEEVEEAAQDALQLRMKRTGIMTLKQWVPKSLPWYPAEIFLAINASSRESRAQRRQVFEDRHAMPVAQRRAAAAM